MPLLSLSLRMLASVWSLTRKAVRTLETVDEAVTLTATCSLCASKTIWSKVASPKVSGAPSSIHDAAGFVAAMLILCSPLVVIVVAKERRTFSSLRTSMRRLSYSSGTR